MGFIENIKESLGENVPNEPLYRAVIFGENSAYIENVRGILSFSNESLTLSLKSGTLEIFGEKLYIKKYCGGDIIVCGKILRLERK